MFGMNLSSQVFDAEKHEGAGAAAAAEAAAAVAAAVVAPLAAAGELVFNPAAFDFLARAYRIHFKNGHSGEYDGAVLGTSFPFDVREVERIELVEEVGA